ncbi:MAG: acyl carrier protein [Verrucomicrobia bacterium]|nr:acyl carrier protein [Verrucomicrobiota bacterium]
MESSLQSITTDICLFLKENILAAGVEVRPDLPLSNIGVDSFAIMEIVLFIERRFGLTFPLEELTPDVIESVDTLSRRCHALIHSPS